MQLRLPLSASLRFELGPCRRSWWKDGAPFVIEEGPCSLDLYWPWIADPVGESSSSPQQRSRC